MNITLLKRDEMTLAVHVQGYHEEFVTSIRKIAGRRWNPQEGLWLLPYITRVIEQLIQVFTGYSIVIEQVLRDECYKLKQWEEEHKASRLKDDRSHPIWNAELKQRLKDELVKRGYSSKTIRVYCSHVERFLVYVSDQYGQWQSDAIHAYTLSLLNRGCSHVYVNQAISAIKFYGLHIVQFNEVISYVRPKKEKKLPRVLSSREVLTILQSVRNAKHKAILFLTYSSGLRVGEVVRLRVQDLDPERQMICVRQGKGRKDRMTLLSEQAFEMVKRYCQQEQPDYWLFPGHTPGSHLTERTVQKVFAQAVIASGIKKQVSVHTLRHSFATHLLENGIDIRYIQELLGHQSTRTTEIYTHVSTKDIRRIKSPLDQMNDQGWS